jgi:hypothetical protein
MPTASSSFLFPKLTSCPAPTSPGTSCGLLPNGEIDSTNDIVFLVLDVDARDSPCGLTGSAPDRMLFSPQAEALQRLR